MIFSEGAPTPSGALIFASVAVLFISLFLLLILKKTAQFLNVLDYPGERKTQEKAVALLGGVPFFVAFLFGTLFMLAYGPSTSHLGPISSLCALLAGGILIFATGLLDDFYKRNFPAHFKLVGQIISASIVVFWGVRFSLFHGSALDYLITFLWLLWIPNAFNMLDNTDGLCGGCSFFVCAGLALLFFQEGEYALFLLAFLCLFSLLAFLFFNFPPSSLYMGDCGSLFLGFLFATFSIYLANGRALGPSEALSASLFLSLLFGVFLLDFIFIVLWRVYNRKPPWIGDRNHLAHSLLKSGFSPYTVLTLYYFLSVLTVGASILVYLY